MSIIGIIQLLPVIYKMLKAISLELEDGHNNYKLKKRLELISSIHTEKDPVDRARRLNELFNEKIN